MELRLDCCQEGIFLGSPGETKHQLDILRQRPILCLQDHAKEREDTDEVDADQG